MNDGAPGQSRWRNGRLPEDLRDRTKKYSAEAIRLFIKLPKEREEVRILGKQFLRSATSVAAHVREASRARSDAEFISKLGGVAQEADESSLWLELLREECGIQPEWTQHLETESVEILAIFTSMAIRTERIKQRKADP
jgi:four helix bundle protein